MAFDGLLRKGYHSRVEPALHVPLLYLLHEAADCLSDTRIIVIAHLFRDHSVQGILDLSIQASGLNMVYPECLA
jgi:hypothetical protein